LSLPCEPVVGGGVLVEEVTIELADTCALVVALTAWPEPEEAALLF
jgi:hypothetical protein